MPRARAFAQVDVFATRPLEGNPVAVVLDAKGVDNRELARFARWTNLSETTFVLPPRAPDADYRVRIFTPTEELPFAGHPTLGTCHAWLEAGGVPKAQGAIVQECEAGLIDVRATSAGLAFRAPPLTRSGPVDPAELAEIAAEVGIDVERIVDAAWTVNGPPWVSLLLADAAEVLAVRPGTIAHDIGLVAPQAAGSDTAFEVRAFFPKDGVAAEDPVTGSLNAGLAMWMRETGQATLPYVAAQGTALGRDGRVHVSEDDRGAVWVGGATTTLIQGSVRL